MARLLSGHPWIFKSDVMRLSKDCPDKSIVGIRGPNGQWLGRGLYSNASDLWIRTLTRGRERIDRTWFMGMLERALVYRVNIFPRGSAFRWVHGEADGLPGLFVDLYKDSLSIQVLSSALESMLDMILELLVEVAGKTEWFENGIKNLVLRNDASARKHESLQKDIKVFETNGFGCKLEERTDIEGAGLPVTYGEWNDLVFTTDLVRGQKTGDFLDQQENHLESRKYAMGPALDVFSYHGGFALNLARAGSSRVTSVEAGDDACAVIGMNAERNSLADRIKVVKANAFDYLRDRDASNDRYQVVVLDPPSLAKKKSSLDSALRGYKELNLRAMKLVERGGVIITCCCSPHVNAFEFDNILSAAAADTGRTIQVLEKRGAGRDHPVRLGVPETEYLKCWFLRVL
ncbi:MAG: class I SAM-dependent rRNA methyltransferase [Deltaproteobacteria bacterium]|nr:class I SAM-dependent rRNA methyltransferase [Deltaproteobacteria bacterium]